MTNTPETQMIEFTITGRFLDDRINYHPDDRFNYSPIQLLQMAIDQKELYAEDLIDLADDAVEIVLRAVDE